MVRKDVRGRIDSSFQRRPIPFIFFHLHSIEMLVYGLTLNQDVFELWHVQLVNC